MQRARVSTCSLNLIKAASAGVSYLASPSFSRISQKRPSWRYPIIAVPPLASIVLWISIVPKPAVALGMGSVNWPPFRPDTRA